MRFFFLLSISFLFSFLFFIFYASGSPNHPDLPVWTPHRNSNFFHTAAHTVGMMRDWIFSSVQSMVHQSDDSPFPPSSKPRSVSLPLYGSVHATAYWFADVYLGSPQAQLQSLIIDTGSSVTGFPCSDCQNRCGAHIDSHYNISVSRSVKPVKCVSRCPLCAAPRPTQFSGISSLMSNSSLSTSQQCAYQVRYTEGSSLTGAWYEDLVILGQHPFDGRSTPSVSVSVPFGCHAEETHLFLTQDASGILGLEATSRFGPPPFMTSVLADLLDLQKVQGGFLRDLGRSTENHTQTSDTEPVFAMCISQNGGILTIGASNTQYHTSRDTGPFAGLNRWRDADRNRQQATQLQGFNRFAPSPLLSLPPTRATGSYTASHSHKLESQSLLMDPTLTHGPMAARTPSSSPTPSASQVGFDYTRVEGQSAYPQHPIFENAGSLSAPSAPSIGTRRQESEGGFNNGDAKGGAYGFSSTASLNNQQQQSSFPFFNAFLMSRRSQRQRRRGLTEAAEGRGALATIENLDHVPANATIIRATTIKDSQTEEDLSRGRQTDDPSTRQTQQSQQQPSSSSNPFMENSLQWTPFILDPEEEGGWPGSYVAILQGWKVQGTATGDTVLAVPHAPQPLLTRTSQTFGLPALIDSGTTLTYLPFLLYTNLWTALLRNIAAAKRARRRRLTATRDTDDGSDGRTIRIAGIRKVSGASLTMMQEKLDAYIEGLMETQRKTTERTPGRHMRETTSNVEQGRETTTRFPEKEMDRELKLAEGVRREMQELGLLLKEEEQFSDVEQKPMDIAESLLDSDDDTAEREATKRSFRENRMGVDSLSSAPTARSVNEQKRWIDKAGDTIQGARPLRRLVPVSVRNSDEECWYLSDEDNDLSYFPDMVLQFANHMDHVWPPTSYLYRKGKARVYCLTMVMEEDGSGRSTQDDRQSDDSRRLRSLEFDSRRLQKIGKQAVLGSSFFIHHDVVFHLGRWEMATKDARCPSTDFEKRKKKIAF